MNLTAQIDNEPDYPLIQQNIQRKVKNFPQGSIKQMKAFHMVRSGGSKE